MRISDWSSDVCSSDLLGRIDERRWRTASPAFARCLLSHFRAFAHFPKEIEIMNRRFGVVATLVVSALAFTGGAILYSGSVAGEPAPKAVAGPVDELIRPHSAVIGQKKAPGPLAEVFQPSSEASPPLF